MASYSSKLTLSLTSLQESFVVVTVTDNGLHLSFRLLGVFTINILSLVFTSEMASVSCGQKISLLLFKVFLCVGPLQVFVIQINKMRVKLALHFEIS